MKLLYFENKKSLKKIIYEIKFQYFSFLLNRFLLLKHGSTVIQTNL